MIKPLLIAPAIALGVGVLVTVTAPSTPLTALRTSASDAFTRQAGDAPAHTPAAHGSATHGSAAHGSAAPGPAGGANDGMVGMIGMAETAGSRDVSAATRRMSDKPLLLASRLSGRNEVPVAGGPAVGDRDGSATAIVRVHDDRVTFVLEWKGITAPTLGHVHAGKAGVNGAVKVGLFGTAMPDTTTAAAGSVTVTDRALVAAIRENPSAFYVNLHTKEFPGGAVRGQLAPLNGKAPALRSFHGDQLRALLSGAEEVPVADGPAVGDRDGRASALVAPSGRRVDYALAWRGLAPTLGHIHRGPRGENGPVVVPIFGSAAPATVHALVGTVTDVDPEVARDLRAHPEAFYVNLHSAEFPGGAVRGQLAD